MFVISIVIKRKFSYPIMYLFFFFIFFTVIVIVNKRGTRLFFVDIERTKYVTKKKLLEKRTIKTALMTTSASYNSFIS